MNKAVLKKEMAKKQAYGILKSEGIYLANDLIKKIENNTNNLEEKVLILRRKKENEK